MFLSYARADEGRAEEIRTLLENAGFSIWWDRELQAGAEYSDKIADALDRAKAVVVLWSANSIKSHWVRDEAETGRNRSTLVPVSLDGTLPPLGFRQFQAADLSHWNGAHDAPEAQAITRAVRTIVEGDTADHAPHHDGPIASPASRVDGRSRRWLAGALALAVLAVVGVWSWMAAETPVQANTLAILPFENANKDAQQDYFSNGLSSEVRQFLSQGTDIRISAESSTEQAAKEDKAAESIARRLGVRYVLDGEVHRVGSRVRVAVQLIDGEDGFDVWSQVYDRNIDDIFAVQRDIARQVANSLKTKIGTGSGASGRIGGTDNTQAYDAFLRGSALYDLAIDEASDRAALAQLQTAVSLDPQYGAAWAQLSTVQTTLANSYSGDDKRSALYDEAIASARKAIDTAPDLATGHAALGYVLLNGRLDPRTAGESYRKAYDLAPNDSEILHSYGTYMARIGEFDAALDAIDEAISLDPLNAVLQRLKGLTLYLTGDFDEARSAIAKARSLNPEINLVRRMLGDIAYAEGDYPAALSFYKEERPGLTQMAGLAMAHNKLGNVAEARAATEALREKYGDNSMYQMAQIEAQAGRIDEALDTLERAFAVGDSGLVLARNDPLLAPLRPQPRYRELMKRIGFTLPD